MNRVKELFEFIRSKLNSGSAAELSWVFLGQVLNVGLGFVILKLLSKLGTYDYGIYALVITISSLLALLFYGPLLQGFTRFYYEYLEKNQINIYLKTANKILFSSAGILILITLFVTILSPMMNTGLPYLFFIFAGILILLQRTGEFFNGLLNIIRKRKQNSILQGLEKLTLSASLLYILLDNRLDLVTVFISFSIILLVFTVIKILVFRKNVPLQSPDTALVYPVKKEINRNIITYIIPFIIWGLSGWLQINGEKWIIAEVLSTSQVGIYAIMMSLVGALIAVPGNVLSDFSVPIVYKNYADLKDKERIRNGYSYIKMNVVLTFLITLTATVVTALAGKEIIILISTPEYSVYWYLLPVLCFGSGLYYTGQSLTILGMAMNQPKRYLLPKISVGLISVIVNLFLISRFGINGAAYSMVITGLFYLIYIYIINRRILFTMEESI
jgi:O-antigen/teichoic acid export membrane protein